MIKTTVTLMHSLFNHLANGSGTRKSVVKSCPGSVIAALLLLPMAAVVQAQSSESDDSSNPVVEELESNLENERKELENVLKERETMLAEQAGVRDRLAEQQKELEEKMDALLELCEQHNAVNADNPIDCEKEIGGN